ncbi:hypothetical protein F2Q69_00028677 [Brassica cretica]|uniref:Uncharacterized protein n=1 Tax=Brassica cretica TaxID=69181 RepID=A0A8S9S7H0_BRACR|nr:hypothetical protein F2Q69_00028677 [Brassica cretica]
MIAPPPPVLVAERRKFLQLRRRRLKLPGCEGSVILTSPASGYRCCLFARVWVMVMEGEEDSWFRWRLEGIMSSGETRVSVIRYGGLVRRRRSGRGGAMRGALTVKISTRVPLQPPRRTRTRACRCWV